MMKHRRNRYRTLSIFSNRVISLLLSFALLFSIIPPVLLADVVAVERSEGGDLLLNFGYHIGNTAEFTDNFPVPVSKKPETVNSPFGTQCEQVYTGEVASDLLLVIVDYYYNEEKDLLWYCVEAAPGHTLPEKLANNPWVFQDYVKNPWGASLTIHSAGKNVVFDAAGDVVSAVTLPKNKKVELTACSSLVGSVAYQWQICYDREQDLWADIRNEKNAMISVSYAMVQMLLDDSDCAWLRCVGDSGVKQCVSEPIAVQIVEPVTEPTESQDPPVSAPEPRMAMTRDVDVSDIVTVTVRFLYGSTGDIAWEPLTASVLKGSDVNQWMGYALPMIEGYDAYLEGDEDTICTIIDWTLNNVQEDTTITYYYWPAKVNYTVIYMWQNAHDDKYTEHERITAQGFTGSLPNIEEKTYAGYEILWYENATIAADGSTIIEIFYDRTYYLMLFDLGGGYGVNPVYARHGTELHIPAPTKPGNLFVGWDDVTDGAGDGLQDAFPAEMPMNNTRFAAIWKADQVVTVTVVYWGQSANDQKKYDYIKSDTVNVKNGTEVSFKPGQNICNLDNHTHGAGCEPSCGIEAHAHSEAEGCYSCGNATHNHTANCYTVTYGNNNTSVTLTEVTDPSTINTLDNSTAWGNGVVKRSSYGSSTYYMKLDGKWYQLTRNGSISIAQNTKVTVSYKTSCPGNHVHEDACIGCVKELHNHTSNCYDNCIEHTHSADTCQLNGNNMDSTLWDFEKAEPIKAEAGGQNVINVYYVRKEFTITFKKGNQTVYTLKERWGVNISSHWPIKGTNNEIYNQGQRWKPSGSSIYSEVLVYIDIMPAETFTLTVDSGGTYTYNMHYMVEVPQGTASAQAHTYNNVTKYFIEYKVVVAKYGYITEDEDFMALQGYDKWTSNPQFSGGQISQKGGDVYFYYSRGKFTLTLDNNSVEKNENTQKTETVLYNEPLSSFSSYVPPTPDNHAPGSVYFDGWYLNPDCTSEEYKLDENTMPPANLLLYAKWSPVEHTVRFYTEKQLADEKSDAVYSFADEDGELIQAVYRVTHGDHIQKQNTPPNDPTKGQYEFVGWFYVDEHGVEQWLDFDNTPINSDMYVYAKWGSNIPMEYSVDFVYVDPQGNEIPIADPISGYALAGNSKTFEAKGNTQLYAGYQEGYFPVVKSHTINIDLEDTSQNHFTFYYVRKEAVPYSVYYVTLDNPKNGKGTVELNGTTYYLLADTKTDPNNKKAIVTETYKKVSGYMPTSYQETLVLDPDAADADTNRIIFVYNEDIVNGMYVVHYYFQDLNGNFVEDPNKMISNVAVKGTKVDAPTPDIVNFTFDASRNTALSGTVSEDELHLHVYYTRNRYNYKVQYHVQGTTVALRPDTTGNAYFEDTLQFTAPEIENYNLVTGNTATMIIRKDAQEPTLNVITFYYVEKTANIRYEVVGAGGLLTRANELVKITSGVAQGSTATALENYKFVGWFDNKECDGTPISTEATYIPQKTGAIWEDAVYYALFTYDLTTLTISKTGMEEDATTMYWITGEGISLYVLIQGNASVTITNLKVGKNYTVTEITDWSWEYAFQTVQATGNATPVSVTGESITVQLGVGNNGVQFTNALNDPGWLDGEDRVDNQFENP